MFFEMMYMEIGFDGVCSLLVQVQVGNEWYVIVDVVVFFFFVLSELVLCLGKFNIGSQIVVKLVVIREFCVLLF